MFGDWQETRALCPSCITPMFVSWHLDVSLHGCGTCGGAWLDNAGCARLLGASLPEGVAATARASLDGVTRPTPGYRDPAPRGDDAPRKCPWCAGVLARSVFHGVALDSCRDHGTFFDPHELFALNQVTVLKAAEDDAFVAEFKRVLAADRAKNKWVRRPLG